MKVPAEFHHTGFFDLICDAVFQYRLASSETDSYRMNRHARASITASALTLESGANCVLALIESSKHLTDDLDRLPTISKYDAALRILGYGKLDRSRNEVQRMKELVQARNELVHSKAKKIDVEVGEFEDRGDQVAVPMDMVGETWPSIGIPKRALFWSADNAKVALTSLCDALRYVFVEIMGVAPDEANQLVVNRVTLGDAEIRTQFEEFDAELEAAHELGVDFSFLGVAAK